MMKRRGFYLIAAALFAVLGLASCSEEDDTVEEYPNWQASNEAYFNHLTDLKTSILYYQAQLPQNFTHIAENGRTGTTGEGAYVNGDGER